MTITDVKQASQANVEQNLAAGSTYIPDLNDKAMERRIVRKIDMRILPFICISYLINFLDRVSKLAVLANGHCAEMQTGQFGQCSYLEQQYPSEQHRE